MCRSSISHNILYISHKGVIGLTTTLSLKFENKKNKPQVLSTRAIQLRFDTYKNNSNNNNMKDQQEDIEIFNTFVCSPAQLTVNPNELAILYVSFTPGTILI